ncbi:MAG TPA: DUF2231 domain-containing protein [Solirubrobacteraceae bacterium]|nr:DUF2231 domain-containing protein [Solirubrobacteraceae bacterium]
MTATSSSAPVRPARVEWRRAEFVLTGLAFLGFLTLGIRITTISSGLPAHPLFIHVPVILIPVSVIGALAVTYRPAWLERWGIALCLCAIVAMSSTFLAMQAGAALTGALHLSGRASQLIAEHATAAKILAIAFTALTALLILTFSATRIGDGRPTGLAVADSILAQPQIRLLLRAGVVLFSLICAFYVYRVGDLGAQAVWLGRLPVR